MFVDRRPHDPLRPMSVVASRWGFHLAPSRSMGSESRADFFHQVQLLLGSNPQGPFLPKKQFAVAPAVVGALVEILGISHNYLPVELMIGADHVVPFASVLEPHDAKSANSLRPPVAEQPAGGVYLMRAVFGHQSVTVLAVQPPIHQVVQGWVAPQPKIFLHHWQRKLPILPAISKGVDPDNLTDRAFVLQ